MSKNPESAHASGQSPKLGFGLRRAHYTDVLQAGPALPHFELVTDNYLSEGGVDIDTLEALRGAYPFFFHGVGLSLGASDSLSVDYLRKVKSLVERFEPVVVSDHVSWGSAGGRYFHDLLPLPFTKETLAHLTARLAVVQDFLKRPLALENVSSYVRFKEDEYSEPEFLAELIRRSGSRLLLDVNNVFVNSENFGFDPLSYIKTIPVGAVAQIHVAGAKRVDDFYLDDHGSAPAAPVIELLRHTLERFGGSTPIVLEWDSNIPEFSALLDERERILECLSV